MQRYLSALAVSLLCTPLFAQQFGSPAFEVPMVVLRNDQDAMIEVLDNDGDGDKEALCVRISIGSSTSTTNACLRPLDPSLINWQASVVSSGSSTNHGTMTPSSDIGQVGTPDVAEEAVYAVGDRLWVIAGYALLDTWTGGTRILDVAIADFDGDGDGDVVALTEMSNGTRVLRLRRWTSSGFINGASYTLPAHAGAELMAADFSGDTIADSIVVGPSMQAVSLQSSAWTLTHDVPIGVVDPMPAVGDIDNDGDSDLVVFGHTAYVVVRQATVGNFVVESPVVGGPATQLYDVDGDGDLDGTCCSGGGGGALTLDSPMTYHISINDNGTFLPAYKMHGIGGFYFAGVHDVDGNGFPDLIAGRTIHYSRQSLAIPPAGSFTTATATSYTHFDADGDGDVDLVDDSLQVHQNRGDGAFDVAALQLLTAPAAGTSYQAPVITGDFDGDGDEDMIVNVHDSAGPVATRLLLQRGDAYADGGTPLPAGMTLHPELHGDIARFVVADLDLDSDLDIVLNAPAPTISATMLHNDGTGHFTATPFPGFTVKAVADFTNDGVMDLLVCDGRLLLQRGVVAGGYQNPEQLTLTGYPHLHHATASHPHAEAALVRDWNGDGVMDVVVRQNGPPSAQGVHNVILTSTSGAFPSFNHGYLPAWATGGALNTRSLHAAVDVDGDGNLDIVVSDSRYGGEHSTVIVFGTGNAQLFDANRTQNLMLPFCAFADVDADGDADALQTNLVRNNSIAAPAAGVRQQWSAGSPGAGGRTPLLGVGGVVAAGHTIEVRASGLQGQTIGFLALDTTTWVVPLFGGISHVPPTVTVGLYANGAAGLAGDGNASVSVPLSANLAGLKFHMQAAFLDGAVGISLSNPATITVGQ